jgi:hypothetical protein
LGGAESSLGDAESSLGDAKSSLGDAESSLGDAKSSLGGDKSSLGDAESSLGDAKSSLGDAKSSLGDAESSLGDAKSSLGARGQVDPTMECPKKGGLHGHRRCNHRFLDVRSRSRLFAVVRARADGWAHAREVETPLPLNPHAMRPVMPFQLNTIPGYATHYCGGLGVVTLPSPCVLRAG